MIIIILILTILCIFYILYGLAKEGSRIDKIFKETIEKRIKNN